jgi:hypothetical protein
MIRIRRKLKYHRYYSYLSIVLVSAVHLWGYGSPNHQQALQREASSSLWHEATMVAIKQQQEVVQVQVPVPVLTASTETTTEMMNLPCSCWNSSALKKCCSRRIVRTHKMGHAMSKALIDAYNMTTSSNMKIRLVELKGKGGFRPKLPQKGDLRIVMIVRNLYDALVSGYLYHKTGRECWLGPTGMNKKPLSHKRTENGWDWEPSFNRTAPVAVPRKGRSICQYLADESEEDGLRVFVEFSFSYYWKKLLYSWNEAQKNPASRLYRKFHIACYEDLINPASERAALHSMVDFLYPGGFHVPDRVIERKSAGGHATSTDPILRSRLRGIIERLDQEVFHGNVLLHQTSFQCTSSNVSVGE